MGPEEELGPIMMRVVPHGDIGQHTYGPTIGRGISHQNLEGLHNPGHRQQILRSANLLQDLQGN